MTTLREITDRLDDRQRRYVRHLAACGGMRWGRAPRVFERLIALGLAEPGHDAGKRAPLRVRDVTSRAATIEIVGDEGVGPSRSARQWMDALPQLVVVIGSTAW